MISSGAEGRGWLGKGFLPIGVAGIQRYEKGGV